MKTPILTIIIPVYNSPEAVQQITSDVLEQDFDDFELILVDDGSTDNTLNVLRGIQSKDKRVVVRSKKNGGPSSARNTGLQKARGDYIIFFDADDSIEPDSFGKLMKHVTASRADLIVTGWKIDLQTDKGLVRGYKTILPEQKTIKGETSRIKTYTVESIGDSGLLYNLWNKVFRADIIRDNKLRFREDVRFGEDLLFTFDYLAHTNYISILPHIIYRYQANSTTSIFSSSALIPEYRQINAAALDDFAGEKRSRELDDFTNWVHWRWLLSYSLMLQKSSLTPRQKREHLKNILHYPHTVAANSQYIGFKKYSLECILSILRRSSHLLLFLAATVNLLKSTIITVKTLQ